MTGKGELDIQAGCRKVDVSHHNCCLICSLSSVSPQQQVMTSVPGYYVKFCSAEFCGSYKIPWQRINSMARLEIPWSMDNCGPYNDLSNCTISDDFEWPYASHFKHASFCTVVHSQQDLECWAVFVL